MEYELVHSWSHFSPWHYSLSETEPRGQTGPETNETEAQGKDPLEVVPFFFIYFFFNCNVVFRFMNTTRLLERVPA